jgi:hypothetical protein
VQTEHCGAATEPQVGDYHVPIWKIGQTGPERVSETRLSTEKRLESDLEDWILGDPSILGESLLVIGRQVKIPDTGDRIDILAIDLKGNAVVVELKRGKLKDPVDMQALRYASYVSKWQYDDFENHARNHLGKQGDAEFSLNGLLDAFFQGANVEEVPDLNADQRVIVVGAEVRDKLGSVALWLSRHNVDIKIVEVELYKDGKDLFLQPQVIVPQPVGRFSSTGRPARDEGAQPWVAQGMNWHLDKQCSARTKEMLLSLNQIVEENFEVDGPRWDQKFYVAYWVANKVWLAVHTHKNMLLMDLYVKAGTFKEEEFAGAIGVSVYDTSEPMSEKLGLPSSVRIRNRGDSTDQIVLRMKEDFDVGSGSFLGVLRTAYASFSK